MALILCSSACSTMASSCSWEYVPKSGTTAGVNVGLAEPGFAPFS
ncbi:MULTISPECIES: hypothetical protein [Streptomyces]|nr:MULTISPECIES: hypothetical protein [Streptomyces]